MIRIKNDKKWILSKSGNQIVHKYIYTFRTSKLIDWSDGVTRRVYRKQDNKEWGWFTTVPFPQKHTAEFVANQKRGQYEDVMVEETQNGYVVKYRGPRK